MKKIILKIFMLVSLLFCLNYFLWRILEKKLNLNVLPEQKEKFFEINSQKYNTLLLGSSRTYAAINVKYINAFSVNGMKLNTYNCGISALFFPNTYHVANRLLIAINIKPKVMLVEFGYDDKYLLSDFNSLLIEPYSRFARELTFKELYNFIRIRIKTLFEWSFVRFPEFSGVMDKGFITMNKRSTYVSEHILQHKFFLEKESDRTNQYDPRGVSESDILKVDSKIFKLYLVELLAIAKKNNIKLIYYLPNRISPENRKIIIPVYNSLPDSIKFNPNLNLNFGQTLLPVNSWDLSHLNEKGADIYSKIFAEEFKKQIIDKGYLK